MVDDVSGNVLLGSLSEAGELDVNVAAGRDVPGAGGPLDVAVGTGPWAVSFPPEVACCAGRR
ncbi:hypothetical protein GCM10010273_18260 [Streptomyces lavendulocolor]